MTIAQDRQRLLGMLNSSAGTDSHRQRTRERTLKAVANPILTESAASCGCGGGILETKANESIVALGTGTADGGAECVEKEEPRREQQQFSVELGLRWVGG